MTPLFHSGFRNGLPNPLRREGRKNRGVYSPPAEATQAQTGSGPRSLLINSAFLVVFEVAIDEIGDVIIAFFLFLEEGLVGRRVVVDLDALGRRRHVLALAGVGVGIGNIFSAMVSSVARNPGARDAVFPIGILGFAVNWVTGMTFFVQGPTPYMTSGIFYWKLAFMLIAVFPYYGALLALMVAAGLANSVFHPADYAILNATVDKKRIGRTFSIHTFTGYLGDALAPACVLMSFLNSSWFWHLVMHSSKLTNPFR